jgi:hypothetical protein
MGCPRNSLLQKCRERLYIRLKVVGPFPGPCTSGSYVHRTTLFLCVLDTCQLHTVVPVCIIVLVHKCRHTCMGNYSY